MISPCETCELSGKCNYISMSGCKTFEEYTMKRKRNYPERMTHEEAFLCMGCPFRNEPVYCERAQVLESGCLVLDSRK